MLYEYESKCLMVSCFGGLDTGDEHRLLDQRSSDE